MTRLNCKRNKNDQTKAPRETTAQINELAILFPKWFLNNIFVFVNIFEECGGGFGICGRTLRVVRRRMIARVLDCFVQTLLSNNTTLTEIDDELPLHIFHGENIANIFTIEKQMTYGNDVMKYEEKHSAWHQNIRYLW